MKTDELISRLSSEVTPARGPMDSRIAALLWIVAAGASAFFIMSGTFGMRSDLNAAMARVWFVLNLASLAVIFSLAAYQSLASSIPGKPPAPGLTILLRIASAFFLVTLFFSPHAPQAAADLKAGLNPQGAVCSCVLLTLAAVPGILLVWVIRKRAPVQPSFTAALIGLAIGAIGAFGLSLNCSLQEPLHLVIYHGVPVLLLALLGSLLGRRLLHW